MTKKKKLIEQIIENNYGGVGGLIFFVQWYLSQDDDVVRIQATSCLVCINLMLTLPPVLSECFSDCVSA